MVNVNDLEEGIHPFSVGSRGTVASHAARANAATYDLLHQGSLGATVADINVFRNADKVSIPTNLFHVASALRQYRVLLHMLLRSTHPLTIEFDRFCLAWSQEEADLDELRETTPYFAALILRWLQLRLAYWFSEQSRIGGAMETPNLLELFQKIKLQEQWHPSIPAQYLPRPAPTLPGPTITPPGPATAPRAQVERQAPQQQVQTPTDQQAPQRQVLNTAYDSRYAPFNDMGLTLSTVLHANSGNSPPKNVEGVAMCCSYHIRGKCYDRCQRARDHKPQVAADAAKLLAWCGPCFANADAARA
jgi:hypothetical protein